jgi:hypothetical protein
VLFYAVWVEHQLNWIIAGLAEKKGVSEKEIESLLRETSYRAKCSWLLRILDSKPVSALHMNITCKLMELRNGFVHFKWKPNSEQVEKELVSLLLRVEKTVKYLRSVENKYLYANHKRRLHRAVIENRKRYKA